MKETQEGKWRARRSSGRKKEMKGTKKSMKKNIRKESMKEGRNKKGRTAGGGPLKVGRSEDMNKGTKEANEGQKARKRITQEGKARKMVENKINCEIKKVVGLLCVCVDCTVSQRGSGLCMEAEQEGCDRAKSRTGDVLLVSLTVAQ